MIAEQIRFFFNGFCFDLLQTYLDILCLFLYPFLLQFPLLYQEGVQNVLFSWRRIIGWMFNGVCSAVIIFFICITTLDPQAYMEDGKTAGYAVVGATMYTCVVWVVNCQIALAISYFTLIQHLFIWGGIALWYIFLLVYGEVPAKYSTTAYRVFLEALAPAPSYWIITLFVVVSTLVPYFAYNAVQMRFFPTYHEMIQWIRYAGKLEDPEYCDMIRQRSIRHTTVGFTARSLAKSGENIHSHSERLQLHSYLSEQTQCTSKTQAKLELCSLQIVEDLQFCSSACKQIYIERLQCQEV